MVTAIAEGEAVITVTTNDGGFTSECEITVEPNTIASVETEEDFYSALEDDKITQIHINSQEPLELSQGLEIVRTIEINGSIKVGLIDSSTDHITIQQDCILTVNGLGFGA